MSHQIKSDNTPISRDYYWGSLGIAEVRGKIWGYFGGGTTKIPPYILSTTEIPNDPLLVFVVVVRRVVG